MEWTYDAWNVFHLYALLLEKFQSGLKITWPNFILIFAHILPCPECKNRFLPTVIKSNNSKLTPFSSSVSWHNWADHELKKKKDPYSISSSRVYFESFNNFRIIEAFENYAKLLRLYRGKSRPTGHEMRFLEIIIEIKVLLGA